MNEQKIKQLTEQANLSADNSKQHGTEQDAANGTKIYLSNKVRI